MEYRYEGKLLESVKTVVFARFCCILLRDCALFAAAKPRSALAAPAAPGLCRLGAPGAPGTRGAGKSHNRKEGKYQGYLAFGAFGRPGRFLDLLFIFGVEKNHPGSGTL